MMATRPLVRMTGWKMPLRKRGAFPLHFIDFEGSRLAIPYHSGMHPTNRLRFNGVATR